MYIKILPGTYQVVPTVQVFVRYGYRAPVLILYRTVAGSSRRRDYKQTTKDNKTTKKKKKESGPPCLLVRLYRYGTGTSFLRNRIGFTCTLPKTICNFLCFLLYRSTLIDDRACRPLFFIFSRSPFVNTLYFL